MALHIEITASRDATRARGGKQHQMSSRTLSVAAPPAVRVSVSSDVVSVGDSVWLHCSVSGDPAPIPRWVRANDEPLLLGTCTGAGAPWRRHASRPRQGRMTPSS